MPYVFEKIDCIASFNFDRETGLLSEVRVSLKDEGDAKSYYRRPASNYGQPRSEPGIVGKMMYRWQVGEGGSVLVGWSAKASQSVRRSPILCRRRRLKVRTAVSTTTKQAKAALTGAGPQLFVTDLAASLALYRDPLGFDRLPVRRAAPMPRLREMRSGSISRHVDRSVIDAATRDREDLLAATLALDNAEALKSLFLEFQAAVPRSTRP